MSALAPVNIKIEFIRNFTVEPTLMWLDREMKQADVVLQTTIGDFAGYVDEVDALASAIAPAHIYVLALGLEMAADAFGRSGWPVESICERHCLLVESAIRNCPGTLVVNTVIAPLYSATGLATEPGRSSHAAHVEMLNVRIRELAREASGRVVLLDWDSYARRLGEQGTYDYRFWYASGAPFARAFLALYASELAAVVRAVAGRTRKCLLLDCDNTLWSGVVGEDGIGGIRMDRDSVPGAYFRAFQQSVLDLQRRGVIVALCSKNDESSVLEVIENHPDCLIRREHLATWRINWNDKVQSIAEIAEELNIALDSVVFVDDSAFECELIRSALPQVQVIAASSALEEIPHMLDRVSWFDGLQVTTQDAARTKSYQQNRERASLAKNTGDLSQYKKLLGTRLRARASNAADMPRVVQLLQRTNQFNLTTHRYTEPEVTAMMERPGSLVLLGELEDRFGTLGVISVAIVVNTESDAMIDSMLMSCRALGRDAELAFASALYSLIAVRWPRSTLSARYTPSGKNGMVADFWQRAGLKLDSDNGSERLYRFSGDVGALAAAILPSHVELEIVDG